MAAATASKSDPPPDLPGVTHDQIQVGEVNLHVATAGPQDGPPVLLVHGWPQNWWTWREVIPALAERHRVIAADLRGHGWSSAPQAGYEKEQLASDLLGLLDALSIDRVTWIGHDWGGHAGLLAALKAPERLERLLVLAIPHFWVPRDPRMLVALLAYQGPISAPGLGPRIADPMVRRIIQAGRGPDKLSAHDVDLFARQIPPEVTVAMYRTFLTRELGPLMRGHYRRQTLQVPTTVMVGSRDLITRTVKPGDVAGQPSLKVQSVDGVAHWIPEQRPRPIIDWALSGSG